jgi:hypothetical protein
VGSLVRCFTAPSRLAHAIAHKHVILGIETRENKGAWNQLLEKRRKQGFLGRSRNSL